MALRSKYYVGSDLIAVSDVAVEAGSALVYTTSNPGIGDGLNGGMPKVAPYAGAPTVGMKFAGVAIDTVVVADLTIVPRNSYEVTTRVTGEPFLVGGKGWRVFTNKITGVPAVGDPAYITADSTFGPTQVASLAAVGKFLTAKDTAGYCFVELN